MFCRGRGTVLTSTIHRAWCSLCVCVLVTCIHACLRRYMSTYTRCSMPTCMQTSELSTLEPGGLGKVVVRGKKYPAKARQGRVRLPHPYTLGPGNQDALRSHQVLQAVTKVLSKLTGVNPNPGMFCPFWVYEGLAYHRLSGSTSPTREFPRLRHPGPNPTRLSVSPRSSAAVG